MAQTKKKNSAAKAANTKKPLKPAKKAVKKAVAFVKKIASKVTAPKKSAPLNKTAPLNKAAASSLSKSNNVKGAKAASVVKKSSSAVLIPNSFQPLDDRIIISLEPAAEKTAGGIFIPDTATQRPSRGTVLAKGPGRRNKKGVLRPLDVSVGDMVLFPQFAGQKIEIGADEFLILREEELLGVTTA